jgi:hypothetical protein
VIVSAVLCPAPPLLARALTGQTIVLPELRDACAVAVARLAAARPDVIAVVGADTETRTWDPACRLDLAAYAPALGRPALGVATAPGLPLALGIGGLFLDAAGYQGPRAYQGVSGAAAPDECAGLGRALAAAAPRVGLLAMGDGSARRSASAPGYLDERAEPFDAALERALRDGDLTAILALDPVLAAELLADGRAAWQVLAGALLQGSPTPGAAPGGLWSQVGYCDAPLGVGYLVATLVPASPAA